MNMKDIPAEVFKWLFEQQSKGEVFTLFVLPDFIAVKDDLNPFCLDNEFQQGTLKKYLDAVGYEEKPWNDELPDWIEEMIATDEDTFKDPGSLLEKLLGDIKFQQVSFESGGSAIILTNTSGDLTQEGKDSIGENDDQGG